MQKKAYITGSGCISPQQTMQQDWFFNGLVPAQGDHFKAIEPSESYKEHINPNMLRRMGRAIKMGVTAASVAVKQAQTEHMDAIISGTGLGCFEDSEKFLLALLNNQEQFLTPTSFIQSTHNTVGSQIGLIMKCHEYNYTYVHRGFSFESCVMDALMSLDEGKHNILIGGIEEFTPIYLDLYRHANKLAEKHEPYAESKTEGIQIGEGAAFFVLSDEQKQAKAAIDAIGFAYKPASAAELKQKLGQFLEANHTELNDIDLVLFGFSGDKNFDKYMQELLPAIGEHAATAQFKQLCGEYQTAGAFGTWIANKVIEKQMVPDVIRINSTPASHIKNVLLINGYLNINYSFTLLSAC
ncbi:MAG: beta-ketoacyl synthase chain length factor [Bacteroidia bacterium]